jgi:hypothetical protein
MGGDDNIPWVLPVTVNEACVRHRPQSPPPRPLSPRRLFWRRLKWFLHVEVEEFWSFFGDW